MEPTEIYDHPDSELIPNGIGLSAGAAREAVDMITKLMRGRFSARRETP
jgi:hypothetical protein